MAEEKSQKNWFVRHKVLTGILGVIVLFAIIGSMGDSDNSNTSAPVQQAEGSEEATQAITPKEYKQVFTFSGNGAKKSEPFAIYGDRFKIKYDCKGDLCQAYLHKVGGSLPDVIMNTIGSVKDETIEYGLGQYYIEANTMGTYTFTVEDYR